MPRETPDREIVVASVPASHPYVRHVYGGARDIRLLDDPVSTTGGPYWWPPRMLTAEWIADHRDDFDLLHVHFGMESFPTGELRNALDALIEVGRPLVYTVHDLENPQLFDQRTHLQQVALMIERADALITLTDGAADEIERRYGRRPVVVPHPHLRAAGALLELGAAGERRRVGVHLRDLRPNIDGIRWVTALAASLDELASEGALWDGIVELRDSTRDDVQRRQILEVVGASSRLTLVEGSRSSDAELEAAIAGLDVALLPYRHGTHSGWVELCHDLGVPVVAPRVGYFADQHPAETYLVDLDEPHSLAGGIARAGVDSTRPGSAERARVVADRDAQRALQQAEIVAAHRLIYERVLEKSFPG